MVRKARVVIFGCRLLDILNAWLVDVVRGLPVVVRGTWVYREGSQSTIDIIVQVNQPASSKVVLLANLQTQKEWRHSTLTSATRKLARE